MAEIPCIWCEDLVNEKQAEIDRLQSELSTARRDYEALLTQADSAHKLLHVIDSTLGQPGVGTKRLEAMHRSIKAELRALRDLPEPASLKREE